jgi:FxLD family lantipeptide
MTTGTATLNRPASVPDFDEFELDVRVLITYDSASRGTCPTDDGCGNTNQGTSSTCGTVPD